MYDQAISLFEQLRENFPDHDLSATATYKIGQAFLEQGNYVQAQSFFSRVLNETQDSRTENLARIGLARAYIAVKRFPVAIGEIEKVLAQADREIAAEAQFYLGMAYKGQNAFQEAVVSFLKTKYLYPSETDWIVRGIYQAALCNEELGRLGDARRLYQSILNDYASKTEYVEKAQERLQDLVGKEG
jgi:TolA-binding protein